MKISSINLGLPAHLSYGDKEIHTGGDKHAVPEALLRTLNFDGDGQADLVNHGGADKAVCVYAADLYSHWESVLGHPMHPGAFSENLTVQGALDEAIHVGDIFQIGEAVVQVSQPRQPCGKLAARNGDKHFVKLVQANGTGFYMRVLREGMVRAGDMFALVTAHPARISIAMINDILYGRSEDRALIAQLAAMPEYSEYGRRKMGQRMSQMNSVT